MSQQEKQLSRAIAAFAREMRKHPSEITTFRPLPGYIAIWVKLDPDEPVSVEPRRPVLPKLGAYA